MGLQAHYLKHLLASHSSMGFSLGFKSYLTNKENSSSWAPRHNNLLVWYYWPRSGFDGLIWNEGTTDVSQAVFTASLLFPFWRAFWWGFLPSREYLENFLKGAADQQGIQLPSELSCEIFHRMPERSPKSARSHVFRARILSHPAYNY